MCPYKEGKEQMPGQISVLLCGVCGFYQVRLTPYTECPECGAKVVAAAVLPHIDVLYMVRPQKERWAKDGSNA
jgi:hypothetical protein